MNAQLESPQPAATKLNQGQIVAVKPITIDAEISFVQLDGAHLYGPALTEFVKADGFESVDDFFAFFIAVGRPKRFHGHVIYWEPA